MKIKLFFLSIILVICIGVFLIVSYKNTTKITEFKNSSTTTSNTAISSDYSRSKPTWLNDQMNSIIPQASNLNPNVLKLSLIAYQNAEKKRITNNPLLTIVDYSKPSSEPRLWVIDLNQKKVLVNTWVAHGKNSGEMNATSFSNAPQSLKSSVGVYVTEDVYSGKHGNSLRVQGLDNGFNNNAYNCSIVIHGANYVNETIAKTKRLGRSWGCFAVSQNMIKPLVNLIKNKVLLVAYYPDKNWLNKSIFLK